MTKEALFEQIDEIFGDWHGGVCYIGTERENQIKEILDKAINYNRCSTLLKDKENLSFKGWMRVNGYEKSVHEPWLKDNKICTGKEIRNMLDLYKTL